MNRNPLCAKVCFTTYHTSFVCYHLVLICYFKSLHFQWAYHCQAESKWLRCEMNFTSLFEFLFPSKRDRRYSTLALITLPDSFTILDHNATTGSSFRNISTTNDHVCEGCLFFSGHVFKVPRTKREWIKCVTTGTRVELRSKRFPSKWKSQGGSLPTDYVHSCHGEMASLLPCSNIKSRAHNMEHQLGQSSTLHVLEMRWQLGIQVNSSGEEFPWFRPSVKLSNTFNREVSGEMALQAIS